MSCTSPSPILRVAQRLDVGMIVIGSHGHGRLHAMLVGSVAGAVLRGSKVPVLVAPRLPSCRDMGELAPFALWEEARPTGSLAWYDAYNAVKHDRERNFSRATLE